MCEATMLNYINFDESSRVPKYLQIIDSIIYNISVGNITAGDKIPSINSMSEEFYLSRDTVARAYNVLKDRKIITSIHGKGNYITRTKIISKTNVLFLVNKMSTYKMDIYKSFINSMGVNTHVDLHFYHSDETLFLELMKKYKMAYDYYVVMPHFKNEKLEHVSYTEEVSRVLNEIPKDKLIVLDNQYHQINGKFIHVYQDFELDIYEALKRGIEKIIKYNKIVLVYPEKSVHPYPKGILNGFRKFCVHHHINFEIIEKVHDDMILKNKDLFITIEEDCLVKLIKQIKDKGVLLGSDIGIISYNDTPLKELLNIASISTDFKMMGELAAYMITNKEKGNIKIPFKFIDRCSI